MILQERDNLLFGSLTARNTRRFGGGKTPFDALVGVGVKVVATAHVLVDGETHCWEGGAKLSLGCVGSRIWSVWSVCVGLAGWDIRRRRGWLRADVCAEGFLV